MVSYRFIDVLGTILAIALWWGIFLVVPIKVIVALFLAAFCVVFGWVVTVVAIEARDQWRFKRNQKRQDQTREAA